MKYPREADFVAKVVEATNAVLGILEVVVLDEPITKVDSVSNRQRCKRWIAKLQTHPLH